MNNEKKPGSLGLGMKYCTVGDDFISYKIQDPGSLSNQNCIRRIISIAQVGVFCLSTTSQLRKKQQRISEKLLTLGVVSIVNSVK